MTKLPIKTPAQIAWDKAKEERGLDKNKKPKKKVKK